LTLADDLAASPRRAQYGSRCGFCAWFNTLTADMQTLVLDAINDPGREGATLDDVWSKHGWEYTKSATQRHRRFECKQWARERAS
jgi:hypothetical protein